MPLSYIGASSLPIADPGGDHVSFGDDPPHNVTFTMVFAGDARYQSATVSLTVGVKVDVSAALRGYYRTTTVSGTSYRVYHRTPPSRTRSPSPRPSAAR